MKKQLSIRDWQTLSAYLDDNLSVQEKSRLESKLSSDADLREAFESLRRTRILLRNSPRLKAPRNFTLTSQMVGIKKKDQPSIFSPILKFSTIIASILFVFALLGDFIYSQTPKNASVQQRDMITTEKFVEKEAPAAQQDVSIVPAATILPELEMDAEEAMENEPAQLSNAPIEPLPSTMPSMMKIAPTATVVEMPQLAAAPEEAYSPPPKTELSTSEGFGGGETAMEHATASNMVKQVTAEYDAAADNNLEVPVNSFSEETESITEYQKLTVWRILEIIFGGLIIVSGILALILKSKKAS